MSISRRQMIQAAAVGFGGLALPAAARTGQVFRSQRPPAGQRRFVSSAVEDELQRVKSRIGDPELAWLFENCFPNTLDTTVSLGRFEGKPDAFVITGDIDAMWLRDSSAQLNPYVHLTPIDAKLRELFRGLIGRQARSILLDPYANAFMPDPASKTNLSWALQDETEMRPGVAERKWEIDSLCYPMRLASSYWHCTKDPAPFDAEWAEAVRTSVATFREQQRLRDRGPYAFKRKTDAPTDTLILDGYGAPSRAVGLIHSGFRPSDDACTYPFLIPANLFAVSSLRRIAVVLRATRGDADLAEACVALARDVEHAVKTFGWMRDETGRQIWAYEVDGFGNRLFMDDANVPNLCGLAYLGAVGRSDPMFRRTAARAWSQQNPYFFSGKAASGIGGPHVGLGMIWPMSLIMHALNSDDISTMRRCLAQLKASHAGTGFMHEAFHQDDPARFTRPWFAWANGLFGELIIDLCKRQPGVLAA
jgi:meiotically up-regulated gene 157 (Mug157) protein